jgi:hypothetical protein
MCDNSPEYWGKSRLSPRLSSKVSAPQEAGLRGFSGRGARCLRQRRSLVAGLHNFQTDTRNKGTSASSKFNNKIVYRSIFLRPNRMILSIYRSTVFVC